jgi:ribosome-binding protein aMBF1 (putative translation factor)
VIIFYRMSGRVMPKQSRNIPRNYEQNKAKFAKEIGYRIRSRRIELGIKQETLRAKMELEGVYISRSQLSRIERGDSLPAAIELTAFSVILKVSYQWLLDGYKK